MAAASPFAPIIQSPTAPSRRLSPRYSLTIYRLGKWIASLRPLFWISSIELTDALAARPCAAAMLSILGEWAVYAVNTPLPYFTLSLYSPPCHRNINMGREGMVSTTFVMLYISDFRQHKCYSLFIMPGYTLRLHQLGDFFSSSSLYWTFGWHKHPIVGFRSLLFCGPLHFSGEAHYRPADGCSTRNKNFVYFTFHLCRMAPISQS